jgi:hypothetical protein
MHAYEMRAYEGHAYEMAPVRGTPMRWPMKDARLWETRLRVFLRIIIVEQGF